MDKENEFYGVYEASMREVIAIPLFHGKVERIRLSLPGTDGALGQCERIGTGTWTSRAAAA